MNILFLSHLSGASYAGPTYSVPKQIEAQSKIDNVFWYNACCCQNSKWKEISYYHDISEYPGESIYELPSPFDNPDIIVVEGFYNMTNSKLRKELIRSNIPFVIIPRGELTKQAQKRKRLKKTVANLLYCYSFAHNASAIQYLTEQEYLDSGTKWNTNHIVIPNGIDIPDKTKTSFSNDCIKCISIGRLEPYQKGLDILIDACAALIDDLNKANCTIKICGPDTERKLSELKEKVSNYHLDDVITFDEPLYFKDKETALLNSDLFIMTSRFEGHPMALIEALSYGLPCFVTKGSNMKPEIDKYDAGWTSDNTVCEVTNALKDMIENKKLFKYKSENAKLLAENYSWSILSNITHSKYMEVCADY